MSDWKTPLRLVEQLDKDGNIHEKGMKKLISAVGEAAELGNKLGCDEFIAFATSAVRSATNSAKVLDEVEKQTGVRLEILSGEVCVDEHGSMEWFFEMLLVLRG